jgi:hypothetical protein
MRQFLEHATGLGIYPMISLVIFVVFFVGMTLWLFTTDKQYLKTMSAMPLDEPNGTGPAQTDTRGTLNDINA